MDDLPAGCLPSHIDARVPRRPVDERSRLGGAEGRCWTRSFVRDPGRLLFSVATCPDRRIRRDRQGGRLTAAALSLLQLGPAVVPRVGNHSEENGNGHNDCGYAR